MRHAGALRIGQVRRTLSHGDPCLGWAWSVTLSGCWASIHATTSRMRSSLTISGRSTMDRISLSLFRRSSLGHSSAWQVSGKTVSGATLLVTTFSKTWNRRGRVRAMNSVAVDVLTPQISNNACSSGRASLLGVSRQDPLVGIRHLSCPEPLEGGAGCDRGVQDLRVAGGT